MPHDAARLDLDVRRADDADEPAVLALLAAALGWRPDDRNRELFHWKHVDNPAGRSPAWVAESDGEIVGYRTFMQWRFRVGTREVRAVRAVDTATHPDHQGRGIFSRLTRHALRDLAADGFEFVFNTPNTMSRPGYLKMGWQPVGRLPIAVVTGPVTASLRLLHARAAAERWSLETDVGDPAGHVLAAVALPEAADGTAGPVVSTVRTREHLCWRYGFEPLAYRAISTADGVVVFRLRRRGRATEAAICETLAPTRHGRRRLVHRVVKATHADYAISLGPERTGLPVPRQGPILVQRDLQRHGPSDVTSWQLSLGDIELF